MKAIASLLTMVSLSLLTANTGAVEFPTTDVPSGIGVSMHNFSASNFPDWQQRIDTLKAAGIGVARIDFLWEEIETTPGQLDFSQYDTVVNYCRDAGIRIYANLSYGNPLYGDVSSPAYYGTDSFLDHFANYATQITDHYSGRNFTWELWNEPNLGFWPGQDPKQYMALANRVMPIIRTGLAGYNNGIATDPTATIVGPSLAAVGDQDVIDYTTYLTGCFNYGAGENDPNKKGLLQLVDGLSVHPYRWGLNPETVIDQPSTVYTNYQDLRALMHPYDTDDSVEIIDGEWGDYTSPGGVTPQTQADYAARMMLVNASQGIKASIYYEFANLSTDPNDGLSNYGIVNSDLTPKPAFYAIKTLTAMTKGATVSSSNVSSSSGNVNSSMIFSIPNGAASRLVRVAWNNASVTSTSNSMTWGHLVLNGTPLYLGQQLTYKGANGLWSGNNWSDVNGFDGPYGWTDYDTGPGYQAKFSAPVAITVDGDHKISGVQLNYSAAGDVALNGSGNLRFTSGGGMLYTGAHNLFVNCTLADPIDPNTGLEDPNSPASCILRKSGSGQLVLCAANTIHGQLLIQEGSVNLNGPNSAQNLTVNIGTSDGLRFRDLDPGNPLADRTFTLGGLAGSGQLSLQDANGNWLTTLNVGGNNQDTIYSGILYGGGSLTKNGTGELMLSGTNIYTGTTTINAGMLGIGNDQALGDTTSAITIAGGSLDLNGFSTVAGNSLSRSISLTGTGSGLANTNRNTESNYSGVLSGTGSLTKYGEGVLILWGDNTYTGATTINAGTLKLGAPHVLGNPTAGNEAIVLDGGTLDFWGWSTPGHTEWSSTDLTRAITVTPAGGTLSNTDLDNMSTYAGPIAAYGSFTVDTAGLIDLRGAITCDYGVWSQLSKIGSGTLYLDGNADNSFLTVIAKEGTTVLAKQNTSANGTHAATALAVASGATVQYAGSGDYQVDPNPGYWVNLNGGTIDFNGRNQTGTKLIISEAGSTLANKAAHTTSVYSPNSIATIDNDFTVNTVGDLVLSGTGIVCNSDGSHWAHLIKTGTGTLTLGGSTNNANLTLDANAGTVILNKNATAGVYATYCASIGSNGKIQYRGYGNQIQPDGGSWINMYGGTLDFNGLGQDGTNFTNFTDGSTLANTVAGTTSTFSPFSATLDANLTVNAVGNLTINGPISGAGKLTKTGKGLLTLGGAANNYSGGTTISAGNLRFSGNCGVADRSITISSGAALVADGASYGTAQAWLNGNKITTASSGALAIAGNTSGINMTGYDNLYLGSTGSYTLSGDITPGASGYRFGGGGGTLTVTSALSGANSLNVNGNVVLSGSNGHTGGTVVNGGTLKFASAVSTSNTTRINAGGTLLASGAYSTVADWLNSERGRLDNTSSGTLALTTSTSSENISMGGYTNLSIGASTNCLYTGTITTNSTNAYHLGGGGAKLTLSSASNLTGAKSVLIGGKVAFSGRKDYAGSTIFNINSPDRVLTLNSNASIPNCTGISLNSGTLFQNSTTPLACPIMLSTSSGTLGGTGTYNTTIDMRTSGGHLSPGSAGLGTIGTMTIGSAGDLHLGENSVLDFDFSATTPGVGDRIVLAGAGHSTTLDGTLNITCSSDRVPTGGYTVISNIDPALMINNGIDLGIVPAGHNWGVYFASHNGLYDLVITAAPEPGTIVLLATGLLGLLAYAWRKRRNQK